MDITSLSGTIIVNVDTETGADKKMQIHSGILMTLKLSKAAKASMEISCCMRVHYSLV